MVCNVFVKRHWYSKKLVKICIFQIVCPLGNQVCISYSIIWKPSRRLWFSNQCNEKRLSLSLLVKKGPQEMIATKSSQRNHKISHVWGSGEGFFFFLERGLRFGRWPFVVSSGSGLKLVALLFIFFAMADSHCRLVRISRVVLYYPPPVRNHSFFESPPPPSPLIFFFFFYILA